MNSQRRDLKMKRNKILAVVLYVLPILFFMVAYFGITVSGEDIYQGAGNYKNGVEITKDEAKQYCLKSEIPDSNGIMPECLNIKIQNIKSIKNLSRYRRDKFLLKYMFVV